MSKRGSIAAGLILVAAAAILSACTTHRSGHGAVYRPQHDSVRTGPVRAHTPVVAPHRDRYRDRRHRDRYRDRRHRDRYRDRRHRDRYRDRHESSRDRRDRRYPRSAKPTTPEPPAHGLYGTQPGQMKRRTGEPAPTSDHSRRAPRQSSSDPGRQATPPKYEPRTKSRSRRDKQPDAEHSKDRTSGS